jgi:hypothetical protein
LPRLRKGKSWNILPLKRLPGNVGRKRSKIVGQDGEIQGISLEGLSGVDGVPCRPAGDLLPRVRSRARPKDYIPIIRTV